MKKLAILLLAFSLLSACTENRLDCSTVSCFAFSGFSFKLLQNGENLLEKKGFTLDQISLSGELPKDTSLSIEDYFSKEGETTALWLYSPNWEQRNYNFSLKIAMHPPIAIQTRIKKTKSTGCCSGLPLVDQLKVNDIETKKAYDLITLTIN